MTQPVLPSAETFLAALYNLALLRRLSGDIAEISQTNRPQSTAVTAPAGRPHTGALLLLPGAFNPPTTAHLELAQESLRAVPGAQLYFTLGTTTVKTDSSTAFKDVACSALTNGDRVEVKGTRQSSTLVLASRVSKED